MTRIMIADDSACVREMLLSILREAGYEVAAAADGAEAGTLTRSFHPDLIITDLNMPTVNGIDLIRSLRADPEFRGIPILMLTSEGRDEQKNLGRAAGATGWILKPFRPDQLLRVLQRVLGPNATPGSTVATPGGATVGQMSKAS